MAMITRARTSSDDDEITTCLDMLVRSSAGTGFMHESVNVNNVTSYTRSWFAWANGLLGELVLQLVRDKPHLVLSDVVPLAAARARAAVANTVSLLSQREALY